MLVVSPYTHHIGHIILLWHLLWQHQKKKCAWHLQDKKFYSWSPSYMAQRHVIKTKPRKNSQLLMNLGSFKIHVFHYLQPLEIWIWLKTLHLNTPSLTVQHMVDFLQHAASGNGLLIYIFWVAFSITKYMCNVCIHHPCNDIKAAII